MLYNSYRCSEQFCYLSLLVPPVMEGPLHETLTQNMGSHITLICEASGVPVPNIAWQKDGSPIGQLNAGHLQILV